MNIQENIPFTLLSTFRTGGNARYFTEVYSATDVRQALSFAKKESVPFLILGGGSNILVSDTGYAGLVIQMRNVEIRFEDKDNGVTAVTAGAGMNFDSLVRHTVSKGFYGLENLSGIPGSVGATPVQNVGAYGAEVKDAIASVEVFDSCSEEIFSLTKEECGFSYRDSIFKNKKGNHLIVLSVTFHLKKTGDFSTFYRDIANYISEHAISAPTLEGMRAMVLEIRKWKLPSLDEYGTAGSFFKNVVLEKDAIQAFRKRFPDIPVFAASMGKMKIPTAWILDKVCGLKGFQKDNVRVYEKQPLALVNVGGATSLSVKKMSDFIIDSVRKKTGITLEPEVCFIGDFI